MKPKVFVVQPIPEVALDILREAADVTVYPYLDRQISVANAKAVREAGSDNAAGRALQREQDDFIARRNAAFGRPDYDLQKAMKERLDHLLAMERH